MEARVSLHQDGDVLGVLLQEPGHRHHHVGLDVSGLLAVTEEHKVLTPRLYSSDKTGFMLQSTLPER